MDLHGADGHVPGQVLQAGDREGPEHPRGHPGKDRRLGGGSLSTQQHGFLSTDAFSLVFLSTCVQIVKALEHLHSNLQVIHRGDDAPARRCPPALGYQLLTGFSRFSRHRRETVQRTDQHSGSGEDVRLRHQRLPGGLGGENHGRRLQTLHGGN